MKNSLLIAATISLFLLNACKEIGPAIDLSGARAFDTSYKELPQAPSAKKILIEEFTGVRCTNCPDAAQLLKTYEAAHPDRIVVAGLHAGAQTAPIDEPDVKSKYDFRNNDVLNMINSYFGENPPKPAASIDRAKFGNEYFSTNRSAWSSYIDQRATLTPAVNVSITSKYEGEKREAVIKVKVSYTQSMSKKQSLNVWLVEDNIVDVQEYPSYMDTTYVHNHVFRSFLTPNIGASVLDNLATKDRGQVYERTFIISVDDKWNPDNCRIIAFVNNNEQDDKSVLQAEEIHLK